jgi:sulfite exporter TauE/SafE
MTAELLTLSSAALLTGFVHCICGPDHYIPFVTMSRGGVWSLRKTLLVTAICGIGHVVGSAALGFIGIAAGVILFQLESVEQLRGDVAAWLLLAFGAIYMTWGLVYARRGHRHVVDIEPAVEASASGSDATDVATSQSLDTTVSHNATQPPDKDTRPDHPSSERAGKFTPWVLFLIFLFGPCEPLIPLLMYPAAQANVWSIIWVTAVFGITTLVTMVGIVALIYWGALATRWQTMEIYGHAAGGAVVMGCGGLILLQVS